MGWAERAALWRCGTRWVGLAVLVARLARSSLARRSSSTGVASPRLAHPFLGHFRQKATAIELARTRGIRLAN
jgi:hypothetical protein